MQKTLPVGIWREGCVSLLMPERSSRLILKLMRITLLQAFIAMTLFGVGMARDNYGQGILDRKVAVKYENVSLRDAIAGIGKQASVKFAYSGSLVNLDDKITLETSGKLGEVLAALLIPHKIAYSVQTDFIVLTQSDPTADPTSNARQPEELDLAQGILVTGTITDVSSGEPLPGATILEKGTNNGTTTDVEGRFRLTCAPDAVLAVSFVGYKSQEVPVNNRTSIDIQVTPDYEQLKEVVVVGYGTQRKENLTAAVSTIQGEDITTTTNSSLAQSLQGKVPGLQIRQQDGEPGSFSATISIRGFGEPLYVIDGIVRDGGVEFQQLNPGDIESIAILKDASAAVYGLNAANGVILVTTKKGETGKPVFNYRGSVGFQSPTDVPQMSTAAQYLELYDQAIYFRDGSHYLTPEELQQWRAGGPGYESTNWFDETFSDYAMQQQHNFSVSGGTERTDYYLSVGHFNEEGLFKSGDMNYKRYNFRSNLSIDLANNLTADVKLSGRFSERKYPGGDGFIWMYKGTIISHPQEAPYINGDPQYPANIFNQQNAVLMSQDEYAGYTNQENKNFNSSLTMTYQFPFHEGLKAMGTVAYDSRNMFNKNVWKNYTVYDEALTPQIINPPRIANAIDNVNRLVFQGQIDFQDTFAERHNVSATAVFEQSHYDKKYAYLKREYDFFTTDVVDYASGLQTNAGSEDERATMSYIGRVNYDYMGKYLVTVAARYDGSYRYAPGKRWGFFPSVSAGWRISEEGFIKDNLAFVNHLKVRASYGMIGENVGDPFQHVVGFNPAPNQGAEFTNGVVTGGIAAPGVINPNFTWVESTIKDIGVEGRLFNDLLTFEADYYEREKTGKLKTREGGLPNTFGGDMPIENLESELTRGFDFIVSHQNSIGEFHYGASFNMNLARTRHLVVDKPDARSSMDHWRYGLGNRWNDLVWGYNKTGQFQSEEEIFHAPVHGGGTLGNTQILPGDFTYEDVNGDGIITGSDMLPIFRNRTPKMFYGFTLNAAWKNFDLNAVFQGASLYNVRFNEVFSSLFFNDGNVPAYFYDRWHLADPYDPASGWVPGKWPAARFSQNMQSSYRESSAWRMDASFLRVKSVELGYTIPAVITGKVRLNNVRLYANAHNLLTFADPMLKMFDPEKDEGPYDAGYNYPLMQSINFGVNVSF